MPNNAEAEVAVLGSLLLDKNNWYKLIGLLTAPDFYEPKHQKIFACYEEMASSGQSIDLVTMSERLESKDELDKIGGRSYLIDLYNKTPTSAHLLQYAKIVKDRSLRRQLITAQYENESDIFNEEEAINTVIATTQNRLFSVNPVRVKSDKVQQILGDLESLQLEFQDKYRTGKKIIGYSCGIEKLDDAIDGLRPGHLWVIGGWHGTGKTSFALNIIHAVLEQMVPTSIITLEMSQVDLTAKLIGIRHELSSMKIIKGHLDPKTAESVEEGKWFLHQTNFEIHTEFDIEKIKLQIRKDVYVRGVKVVMIDYLQKIGSETIFEETALLSKTAKDLSNLAQELGITILAISQISNDAKIGKGAGAGFKGSGSIEASADLAIVLKRDKAKEEASADWVPVKIQITKNKFGFDGFDESFMHLPSGRYGNNPFGLKY